MLRILQTCMYRLLLSAPTSIYTGATNTLKVSGWIETAQMEFDSFLSFPGIYLLAKLVHRGLATRCPLLIGKRRLNPWDKE